MLFLDTNVVIDVLGRNRPEVRRRFAEAKAAGAQIFVPSVVLFELRQGARLSAREFENNRGIDAMLADGIGVVPFDADDAEETAGLSADLRKAGREIGPYDLLIAAQARRRGVTLVTHNLKEFARVPGLVVVDWVD